MFKTKLTVEFEIETQFGPQDAINMVDNITRVPAIKSVKIVDLITDYNLTNRYPADVNVLAVNRIPLTIK